MRPLPLAGEGCEVFAADGIGWGNYPAGGGTPPDTFCCGAILARGEDTARSIPADAH